MKNKITTNFDNSVTYTSATGQELKNEVKQMARELGKKVTDFKIEKL